MWQQTEPLRFSARGFGCALFYFPEKRAVKIKMKERIREVKRLLALILAASMVFALCGCGKSEAVKEVESLIANIGEVSLDKGNAIEQAKKAYNNLSSEEKEKVENYSFLQEADEAYNKLLRAEELKPAQDFAAEILIAGAHLFANPLSVNVKNVWYYNIASLYYFTYELEVKNSAGIVETVYYGNRNSFFGIDEDSLELPKKCILLAQANGMLGKTTDNDYFAEDQIEAMQKGELLDSEAIQDYFIKNYK